VPVRACLWDVGAWRDTVGSRRRWADPRAEAGPV